MARTKKNVDAEIIDDDKFMKEMLKAVDNEYGGLVEDGVLAGDITEYLSTGSYTLNALLSGSVYGGLPGNKILALAGEPSTGKTFFAINILKSFLDDHPQGRVIYFETESAVTKGMFVQRGVDAKRIVVLPVQTVQEFRTQCLKIVNMALEKKPAERPKLMFVLDSLGNLSTEKEMQDTAEGKDTRDMTRAQLIRGAFRTLTLKLGKAGFPLICTNHVFQTIGQYVSTKEMGGGCLVAGTKIKTSKGVSCIENVMVGDTVETLFGTKKVTRTFEFDNKNIYELTFDNGESIRCSSDHKFLVDGSWKSVADMLGQVKNTEKLNIKVSDLEEDLNVLRKQIHENLQ